jgi:hypothetical protein
LDILCEKTVVRSDAVRLSGLWILSRRLQPVHHLEKVNFPGLFLENGVHQGTLAGLAGAKEKKRLIFR